jgi:hypothetical protein
VEFGHAVGLGSLKADDDHDIALVQFPGLEGGFCLVLVMEHAGRCLDNAVFGRDGRDFHHAGAKIAGQPGEATCFLKGVGRGAQDLVIEGFAAALAPGERAAV